MDPLFVHGIGHFHPENVIDNAFLEALGIETSDEWITERVGIRSRRTVLPLDYIKATRNVDIRAGQEAALYSNVETACRAARVALERAGLSTSDIGMVVCGGCAPEMSIPSEACRVAAALELEVPALDINSACSSFGAQMHFLGRMRDLPPYVLVVNPENTTRTVNYEDRTTAVLWGDATSAAIVSTEVPARLRVTGSTFAGSPRNWRAVTIPRFGHFTQEGAAVQHFAIKTTLRCIDATLPAIREDLRGRGGRLRFIGHQANLRMLEGVLRRANIEETEHWMNVEEFGNTGAAGAPSVLSQHWGDLLPGDALLLVVVGSGLAWSSLRMDVVA